MCYFEFCLYFIFRFFWLVFSIEVFLIIILVNLWLDEEVLVEEIEIEIFYCVQFEFYMESCKSLMVMMELLRLLENIDGKLIGLVIVWQGIDIWEEIEVIVEFVKSRFEVSEMIFSLIQFLGFFFCWDKVVFGQK